MPMRKLLIICGPTATGKTQLALALAKQFSGELVSADSRQIYQDMDIATGKDLPPGAKVQNAKLKIKFRKKTYNLPAYIVDQVLLWMYDVVKPDEDFSVSHYQYLAHKVISHIGEKGRLPIVVGGTGLYLKALTENIESINVPPDLVLRQKLAALTVEELQRKVQELNPKVWGAMNTSDRFNPRRLIRKIEVISLQKKPAFAKKIWNEQFNVLNLGLTAPRKTLYQRIDERVESRIKQGIVTEIEKLLRQGYSWDLPAMSSLGSREWKRYFTQNKNTREVSKEKIITQWKFDEHGYARRQITWFKKQSDIVWFDITEPNLVARVAAKVATWYTQ